MSTVTAVHLVVIEGLRLEVGSPIAGTTLIGAPAGTIERLQAEYKDGVLHVEACVAQFNGDGSLSETHVVVMQTNRPSLVLV